MRWWFDCSRVSCLCCYSFIPVLFLSSVGSSYCFMISSSHVSLVRIGGGRVRKSIPFRFAGSFAPLFNLKKIYCLFIYFCCLFYTFYKVSSPLYFPLSFSALSFVALLYNLIS